ncbi:hypothetical protein IZU99_08880 [Oscillospiraceae bacterium CM]|nr:hypothetical protein IZU99_08880 [Oscillospiraceae bacterium CM]
MDGIPSGLTSVTPILPDSSTIAEKGIIKGPPVEIMPLPDNNFQSDTATSEFLNNPYTLSLQIKGYDQKAADRQAPPRRQNAPNSGQNSAPLPGDAYSLSLGGDEAPLPAETLRELARIRNYEQLGKTGGRQISKPVNQAGTAESAVIPDTADEAQTFLQEKVQALLSRFGVLREESFMQEAPLGAFSSTSVPQPPPNSADSAQGPGVRQPAVIQEDETAGQSRALLVSLSKSDYELILTLEPELREALMTMLREDTVPIMKAPDNGGAAALGKTVTPMTVRPDATGDETPMTVRPDATGGETMLQPENDFRPYIEPRFNERILTGKPPADLVRPAVNGPESGFSDDVTRLASTLLTAAHATGDVPAAASGALSNLRKITELPYALYIFGPAPDEKRFDDDAADPPKPAPSKRAAAGPSDFLTLAEAVKMAAVLHNIYHSGSGAFPQTSPWYTPYFQYAVKHGIVSRGAFDDVLAYATRADAAFIFSRCVPQAEFPVINHIANIPDVEETTPSGESIYRLARAGVLLLPPGRYDPMGLITKAEAAALIGRIATPEDRKRL